MVKQANRRRYHYIYKTTCVVTGKYYLGMHSTDNLHDNYIGSGKRLWYSINKHGRENHVCEILEHYFTREFLREREVELVCAETLTDTLCMNIKLGGDGGFDHVNSNMSEQTRIELCKKAGNASLKYFEANPEERQKRQDKSVAARQLKYDKAGGLWYATSRFTGMAHTEETKIKMKKSKVNHGVGDSNSQHGSCWIFSITEQKSKKISSCQLDIKLLEGWQLGRKMNFRN